MRPWCTFLKWEPSGDGEGGNELLVHLLGGRILLYISWQLFTSMRQTLCIDLSRWKAPTELRSRRSCICICIMRRRAALQLSIWLKVELAGDGQGWLSNIYPCNGNSYYHHIHIMLQFDTCCIICICSVLPLSRWTPTLGQRSWSGILGLAQVLGCTALHQQLWVLQLSKGLPCIKNLFWGRLVYWSGWFKSWRYIVEGVICIIPNKPVFQDWSLDNDLDVSLKYSAGGMKHAGLLRAVRKAGVVRPQCDTIRILFGW